MNSVLGPYVPNKWSHVEEDPWPIASQSGEETGSSVGVQLCCVTCVEVGLTSHYTMWPHHVAWPDSLSWPLTGHFLGDDGVELARRSAIWMANCLKQLNIDSCDCLISETCSMSWERVLPWELTVLVLDWDLAVATGLMEVDWFLKAHFGSFLVLFW